METPRPTPPRSQLLPNDIEMQSGYRTPPGSPSGRSALVAALIPNSSALAMSPQEPLVPAKPVSPRPDTIQGMRKYERRVTEQMQRRFQDVLDRLSGPLATYLRKSRHEHRPTVMRLAFLGHDADSVRPWIVVLCPELVKKRAEKFFKKDMARRIYLADEPGRESFQVVVVGQPPRPRAGQSASRGKVAPAISAYAGCTLCSLQVKAEHDGVSRLATIGGYIVASCHDGTDTVYGLTAGHIIPQTGYDSPSSDGPWDGSMPSPASSDSEDEHTITPESSDQSRSRSMLESSIGSRDEPTWTDMRLAEISFSREARDKDWALIEGMRTNQIESLDNRARDTTFVLGNIGEQRSLQMGFDAGVALECILSQTPSMILTPSGHDFVSAHVLIPDASRRLRDGASGTWVTSQSSRHYHFWSVLPATTSISVYGQVVADDMFGDVYMVPLRGIMEDIKTLLDAAVVRLPESTKELWQILTTQVHQEHSDPQSEASSKNLHVPTTNGTARHINHGPTATGIHDYSLVLESPNPLPSAKPNGLDLVRNPRAHICATCAWSYTRREHLERHERNHTQEENSFECPGCTKCFMRQDLLLRHQKKHSHFETNSKDVHGPTTNGKAREEKVDSLFYQEPDSPFELESPSLSTSAELEDSNVLRKDDAPWQGSLAAVSDVEEHVDSDLSESPDKAPKAKKSRTEAPWTPKEDLCLKRMRGDGASWDRIMEEFSDRPEGSVKKHWYKDLRYGARGEKPSASSGVADPGK